jgi:hypothetical protein
MDPVKSKRDLQDRSTLKVLKNRMEDLKKVLQQLRKGAMSIESTTRQKEIQVFIENLLEQQ